MENILNQRTSEKFSLSSHQEDPTKKISPRSFELLGKRSSEWIWRGRSNNFVELTGNFLLETSYHEPLTTNFSLGITQGGDAGETISDGRRGPLEFTSAVNKRSPANLHTIINGNHMRSFI